MLVGYLECARVPPVLYLLGICGGYLWGVFVRGICGYIDCFDNISANRIVVYCGVYCSRSFVVVAVLVGYNLKFLSTFPKCPRFQSVFLLFVVSLLKV